MEPESPCLCLPRWIADLVTFQGCSFCNMPFSKDKARYGATLLIPCGNGQQFVHMVGLELHTMCGPSWQRNFMGTARSKLCDYIPFSVDTLQTNPRLVQQMTDICAINHVFTDRNCGWCKARSQTHVPFDKVRCEHCERVWYCEQACKDAHWPKHRVICEKLSL